MALTLNNGVVDFSQVMPPIFLQSPLLTDYMTAVSNLLGEIQVDIAGLYNLVNPYTVPTQYMQDLANLIGLQLRSSTYLTSLIANSQQFQLINAVAWYKIKGTYAGLQYIGLLLGLNLSIQPFWCSSSANYNAGIFTPESYFFSTTGSSYPSGLNSSYFPTPHYGIYVLLNQAYLLSGSVIYYLWNDAPYNDLLYFEEQNRAVHLVPHFYLQLNCTASSQGGITENPGLIYSSVDNWTYSALYYDQTTIQTLTASLYTGYTWGANAAEPISAGSVKLYTSGGVLIAQDNGSGGCTLLQSGYTFSGSINYTTGAIKLNITPTQGSAPYVTYEANFYDTGLTYDQSYTAFLNSITTYKLGTGNVSATNPPTGGITNVVLSGTGVTYQIFPTYVQFTVTLPLNTVQSGITELGLYAGSTLVFASYFPSVVLTGNESLNIVVQVNN